MVFRGCLKNWQASAGIEGDKQIDFQGLRKSGQMHKLRLMKTHRGHLEEIIAGGAGHSVGVMNKHYDEILDSDKRSLIKMIEDDFYPPEVTRKNRMGEIVNLDAAMQALLNNPELARQFMHLMATNAVNVAQ